MAGEERWKQKHSDVKLEVKEPIMKAKMKVEDRSPPRGKILKEAATGQEKEDALRTMNELSRRAGERAKTLGLTEAELQALVNEP